jgi:hypothetical protein
MHGCDRRGSMVDINPADRILSHQWLAAAAILPDLRMAEAAKTLDTRCKTGSSLRGRNSIETSYLAAENVISPCGWFPTGGLSSSNRAPGWQVFEAVTKQRCAMGISGVLSCHSGHVYSIQ